MPNSSLLNVLARSFLVGEPAVEQIVARCTHTLGRSWRWLPPWRADCQSLLRPNPSAPPRCNPISSQRSRLQQSTVEIRNELSLQRWLTEPQHMQPDRVPPHPSVHGFIKSRSITTFVTPHTGQRIVLTMDMQDFFPSIAAARIQTIFRTAGCPESVADRLGVFAPTPSHAASGAIPPKHRSPQSERSPSPVYTAASTSRCAHLASTGQPLRLPHGLSPRWPRPIGRCPIHQIRRRPRILRRRIPGALCNKICGAPRSDRA